MNFASAVARRLVTSGGLLLVAVSASGAERVKSPSPAESLQAFRVAPGLRVELVAAEPEVVDPVAIAFDELRRLYVVENRGYPDPMDGKSAPPIGRVALLRIGMATGATRRGASSPPGCPTPTACCRGGAASSSRVRRIFLPEGH